MSTLILISRSMLSVLCGGLYSHKNGHENKKENGHGNGNGQENWHGNKLGKKREINKNKHCFC